MDDDAVELTQYSEDTATDNGMVAGEMTDGVGEVDNINTEKLSHSTAILLAELQSPGRSSKHEVSMNKLPLGCSNVHCISVMFMPTLLVFILFCTNY